jgi:hypothetical protein
MTSDCFATTKDGRTAHRGRTYVYVLACHGEDLAKVGFSRNPAQRFQALDRCFYDHFDLDRGMLIETDHLKDARRIERLFIERWPACRASAPLTVSDTAGGQTEWFRGISNEVVAFGHRLAQRYGYPVHAPLRPWLHAYFSEPADLLFSWSSALLEQIEQQSLHMPAHAWDLSYAIALSRALDLYERLHFNLQSLVPDDVLAWRSAFTRPTTCGP